MNIVGLKFGRLMVVERGENTASGKKTWLCRCDCGNLCKKLKMGYDLKSGKVQSCGCIRKETTQRQGEKARTHGATGTRLWRIWLGMKQRCYYKKFLQYNRYGGKGIDVCEEWRKDFVSFAKWAEANGYRSNLTIDRIDNEKGYNPSNCRWATWTEQENNRANNRIIKINGKKDTLSNAAREKGLSAAALSWRINNGWPEEDLFIKTNLGNSKIRKEKRRGQGE